MTYFENDGQGYVIWAYKGGGGSLLKMATVDKTNPVKLTSEPMTLTVPEYEWEKVKEFVNEGAAVLQHDGKIFVAFSAAATGPEYCMGLMSADATDDLMDPASWTKCPYPILETSDLTGQYGPGHNSFTVDENGNDIIVYHARDERCYQDQCEWHDADPLYDPCRNAMLAYVRYDTDGVPVFASTAAKELASAAQEAITYELKVEGDDAQLIASYPLREDATETVSSYTASVVGDAQFDNGLIFTDTTEQNLGNYADLTDRSVSWITSDPKVAVATGSLSTPGAAMIAPIGEGTARITAIANGDPSVRQTITVTVEDQRDPVVSEIEEKYYYTGSKITPAIQVTDDGTLLTEGVDYTISVKNNTAASVDLSGRELLAESKRPTAYLTGKGNYKNVLKTKIAVPFRIIAKDIADADIDVSYIDTYAEPGKANGTVKPSVSVKYGRKTLGKKDYILTWKDADGEVVEKIRTAGTYTGVIQGIGTYGGMKSVNFVILPKWLKF